MKMSTQAFLLILCAAVSALGLDTSLVERIHSRLDAPSAAELVRELNDAEQAGLPVVSLENKVYEGLAKNVPGDKILGAVKARRIHLEEACAGGDVDWQNKLYRLEKQGGSAPKSPALGSPRQGGGGDGTVPGRHGHDKIGKAHGKMMDKQQRFQERTLEKQQKRLEKLERKQEKLDRKAGGKLR